VNTSRERLPVGGYRDLPGDQRVEEAERAE
jgi:hypothetical protein